MKCPSCSNMETRVLDSRVIEDGKTIKRRRLCEYCQNRFTTFERIGITDLIVVKRDGTKELYDREKIKKALLLGFAKRDITVDKLDEIISGLEGKWCGIGRKEIYSTEIGTDILDTLKKIDIVAYIRFASVYQKFDSLEDFKKIIMD
ncbi:MAG: transcriptional regulator NrdR [Candidatus Absconditabacteria bacterium]